GACAPGLAALARAVLAVGRDRLRRWSRGGSWRRRRLWLWLRRRSRLRLGGGEFVGSRLGLLRYIGFRLRYRGIRRHHGRFGRPLDQVGRRRLGGLDRRLRR